MVSGCPWFQPQVCISGWKYPESLHSGAFPYKPKKSKTANTLPLSPSFSGPRQGRSSPRKTTQTQERPFLFPMGSGCYLSGFHQKPHNLGWKLGGKMKSGPKKELQNVTQKDRLKFNASKHLFQFCSLWCNATEVKFIKTLEASFLQSG